MKFVILLVFMQFSKIFVHFMTIWLALDPFFGTTVITGMTVTNA